MKTLRAFGKRHPVMLYFTIALAWITGFTALAFRMIPPDMPDGLGSVPPYLLGLIALGMPSIVALLVTAIIAGKVGVKALFRQFLQGQFTLKMALLAFLLPVLVTGSAYLLQHGLGGPALLPHWGALAAGVGSGLFSSLLEELGWRGFVLARLLKRWSPRKAALLTGLGWGAWHFVLNFIGMRQYGSWMFLISFLAGPLLLTGFTVLMTWVFLRTRGNLLVMVLFHLSITANAVFFSVVTPTAADALRQYLVSAAVVWAAAGLALTYADWRLNLPGAAAEPVSSVAPAAAAAR